jgi:hypothetical protein
MDKKLRMQGVEEQTAALSEPIGEKGTMKEYGALKETCLRGEQRKWWALGGREVRRGRIRETLTSK